MSRPSAARPRLRLGAFLSLILVACVPPAPTRNAPPPSRLHSISRTEIDVAASRYATAYEIVRALRPAMLVTRGATGRVPPGVPWSASPGIKVYLDGVQFGGVESLAAIPARDVFDVQWLSPMDATTRYGTGNTAGAIVVTTRGAR